MLQWLLSLFARSTPPAPQPAPAPQPFAAPRPSAADKIALVIGHNARSKGATRVTDGKAEYDWNGQLAEAIRALAPDRYVIIRRPAGLSYTAEVRAAYGAVDAAGVAGSVELHFNAAADASATGTETLTSGSPGSVRLADQVQHHMVRALGLRNRGVKVRSRSDRGGESLFAGRPPAVLIEPYFGSNRGDCAAADRNFVALAAAIDTACVAFLRGGT